MYDYTEFCNEFGSRRPSLLMSKFGFFLTFIFTFDTNHFS